MATGTIKAMNYVDVNVVLSANESFAAAEIGVTTDRIRSAFIIYTDSVFYTNPILSIATNGRIALKAINPSSSAQTFTVRVFYD